jgi:hypothetical protein
MIRAINKVGMVSVFSDLVWEMMATNKNGFVELGEGMIAVSVPKEITEFKATKLVKLQPEKEVIPLEKPVVETLNTKGDAAGEMEIMKEALKERGIKFHHMSGYDKIKKLYDESSK